MSSPEQSPVDLLDHDDLFDHDYDVLDEWTNSANTLLSENDFDMIDRLSAALDQVTHQLNDKQRDLLQKSSAWTHKTRERLGQQTKKLEHRRTLLEQKLVRQYESIHERMNRDAKTVQLRDKISFVFGVANTSISPALVARVPQWIPLYYTLQFIYLLTLRFVVYKYRRWHYFIFDLCYFVNVMAILYLWVFPSSTYLFYATFALTSGPVAWAIVLWNNSLVFHSLDKVTSVFIHIFPPLVTYVIRWLPELHPDTHTGALYRDQHYPALAGTAVPVMSFRDCMVSSTIAYLIWQALYFVFIMVKRRDKIEAGLRVTSYSWLLKDSAKKSFIQKAAFCFGPRYKSQMFMLLQLVYNIVASIPTYFMFKYFWLHTLFLCTMFGASVWNGGNYYIEVFSRRYLMEIEQAISKKKDAEQQQQQQKKQQGQEQQNGNDHIQQPQQISTNDDKKTD